VIRFENAQQIIEIEPILKAYIDEAIEAENLGLRMLLKKMSEYEVPEELQQKFDQDPAFEMTFCSLTTGR